MFIYDLKKVLLNKKSLLLITILLVMNSLLFFVWDTSQGIKTTDYKEVQNTISTMPLKEASQYVQQEIQKSEKQDKGTYDLKTLQQVKAEVKKISDYPAFLKMQQSQEGTKDISIFHEGGFLEELQGKTKQQYMHKNLQAGTTTKGNYGIEQLVKFMYIDIFAVLLLIYCLYIQIQKEDETGCLSYVKITPKGTLKNYVSKFLSIILCVSVYLLLAYFLIFLIAGYQYGVVNARNPIQSIIICQSIPYKCSILFFFFIALCQRIGVYVLFGCVGYALTFIFKKLSYSLIAMVLLFGVLQVLSFISADNNSLQHYLSVLLLFHPERLWINITYLDIFSHAVYFAMLYFGWAILTIVLMVVGYKRYLSVSLQHKHLHIPYNRMRYHGIVYYETKKIWIRGLGLILMLLLIIFSMHTMMKISTLSSFDDNKVAYYISSYGSSPIKETLVKIQKEETRFQDIQNKIAQASSPNKTYSLTEQLNDYPAFESYRMRMLALGNNTKRKVIKEDQTMLFFGLDEKYAMFLLLFLGIMILLCMQTYSKEQISGVEVLQGITNYGRTKLLPIKHRVISCGFILTIIILNVYLLLKNYTMYPTVSYADHIEDLQSFAHIGIHTSIACYLIFQCIVQIIVTNMLSYCILFAFSKIKANKLLTIIFLLVCSIPLILLYTDFVRTTPLFNLFFPYSSMISWVISFVILLICFMSCILFERRKLCVK